MDVKKFEIKIFQADWENIPNDSNSPRWIPLKVDTNPVIIVSSKKELDDLLVNYKSCDQMFKIVRELPISDEEVQKYLATHPNIRPNTEPKNSPQPSTTPSHQNSLSSPSEGHFQEVSPTNQPILAESSEKPISEVDSAPALTQPVGTKKSQQLYPTCTKPRFYKIGGIDIKDDNGVIYQKQWMRLTDEEVTNLRVVNDKNNAIVSLAGKHIEMKKWVLVENIETDGDSSQTSD